MLFVTREDLGNGHSFEDVVEQNLGGGPCLELLRLPPIQ